MEAQATKIVKTLQNAGFEAVFAGGCVRDFLLGRVAKDYDIATNAQPAEIQALFPKTKAVGKHFGVILVECEGVECEVATFRTDGPYKDGRRPEYIKFASMAEDAMRRDFTMNAIFWDPLAKEKAFHDFVGGLDDLTHNQIVFVGEPEHRIAEDKLRMLRAIRFALQLDFDIHTEGLIAIRQAASEIHQVAAERIQGELLKMLRTHQFRKMFQLMRWTGLMKEILPEVDALKGVEQPPEFHPEGDVWEHTILVLESLPSDVSDELLLGALLHDIGKPSTFEVTDRIRFNRHEHIGADMADVILRRLKFSTTQIQHITTLVACHMRFCSVQEMKVSKLKRFMRTYKFDEHMELHKADCIGCHGLLTNYEFVKNRFGEFNPEEIDSRQQVQNENRLVTGEDLIELGFSPGPIFKEILTKVEDEQLEGNICSKEQGIAFVRENNEYARY